MQSFTLLLLGLVPSALADISCGVSHGYDLGTNAYFYSGDGSLSTFDACSAKCQESSQCQSFAFGAQECLLYTAPLDTNFRPQQNSPFLFNDRDCVKVEPTSSFMTSLPPVTTASSAAAAATTAAAAPASPITTTSAAGQAASDPQTTTTDATATATPGSDAGSGSGASGTSTTRASAIADVTTGDSTGFATVSASSAAAASQSGSGTSTGTASSSSSSSQAGAGSGGATSGAAAAWGGQRQLLLPSGWVSTLLALGAVVGVAAWL